MPAQHSIREAADVEKPVVKWAKANGWFVEKVMRCGRNGFPDRFFAKNGRVVLIEFKAPGRKPSPQQLLRHAELRAAGVEVHVIDNVEEGIRVLRR